MGRAGVRVVVLIVAAALVVLPALLPADSSDGTASPGLAAITDYEATYVLTSAGTLVAQETLTAETASGGHGISRSWDVQDRTDSHARLNPEDVEVRLDGKSVPFDLQWQRGRRVRVLTTDEGDSPVSPGPHVYTIRYVVEGALSPAGRGSSRASTLVWDVVPPGWSASIARTTVRITLPAPSDSVRCVAGRTGPGECTATGVGTDLVTLRTGELGPRTPVSVSIGLPVEAPDRVTVPWPVRADRALGQSVLAVVAVVLLTIVLAAGPRVLKHRLRPALLVAAALALLAIGILWSPPLSIYLLPLAALALALAATPPPTLRGDLRPPTGDLRPPRGE
ncbi:DUF2207 domain-containing protein [Aeromicrobium chenweiae]|uniref:DUF2207 domain-containing protein n=1 Tax=Aeromicrobium chenweiae TaxID=2079793 RepID=A0A2S0WMM5_9ACTN|nr:DUF2207 domain-containing protein [Aeromicrobium chenweiae]AWB92514.1 hypothetical protein C3E78_10060 [Aeromicrobium chenweiae]TGN33500.1 DUF2207 domain-containing protein [Aeromicrobium chenweiae]